MNLRLLVLLNTMAFIAVIAVNYLANALPINGITTGEVSSMFPNYFTPAGFTFAIWGIIYILLAYFVFNSLYQFFKKNELALDEISRISFWFLLSCLANIFWIFSWHHLQIFASLAFILVLLYSLMKIYQALRTMKATILYGKLVFGVYLAWVCVAVIANFAIYLSAGGWSGSEIRPEYWSGAMIFTATALAIYFIYYMKDLFYPLVTMWALFGIYSRYSVPQFSMSSEIVAYSALAGLLIILVLWILQLFSRLIRLKNSSV